MAGSERTPLLGAGDELTPARKRLIVATSLLSGFLGALDLTSAYLLLG